MKRLTKHQREMSREAFDRLNWDIKNIEGGIERRRTTGEIRECPRLILGVSEDDLL